MEELEYLVHWEPIGVVNLMGEQKILDPALLNLLSGKLASDKALHLSTHVHIVGLARTFSSGVASSQVGQVST